MAINNKTIGIPISKNHTLLSSNLVLNKTTGLINKIDISKLKKSDVGLPDPQATTETVKATEIKKDIEIIVGLDKKTINLVLKDSSGQQVPTNGFLIEVYASGSDGRLTKLAKDDVVDPISDEIIEEGFGSYIKLEIDK